MIITCEECKSDVEVSSKRFKLCPKCSRDRKLKRCQEYKLKNKERIQEYNKTYKQENKDSVSIYNKKYNIENRTEIQKRQTAQHKERRKTDPKYKMSIVLRNRFRKFYKGINKNILKDIVGCSYENYIKWVEFNFDSNMSWDNHGSIWHIDHVLLCYMFDHENINDRKICFNWKNTRPLLTKTNLARKKIDMKDLLNHEIRLHYFEKNNREGYEHIEINFAYLTTKLLEKSSNGSS
jgi:hypothetical protein